jgi:uncharacterized protein
MLIRFVVTNFLSFNEEREFNMLAGAYKTHKHHVYAAGKVDVLKAAAIYGANGAGKSNFIKAMAFLQNAVIEGRISTSIHHKKFKLDKTKINEPSVFEIEFFINKKIYIYGLSVHHLHIVEEWLYESGVSNEDKMIFERKQSPSGKPKIEFSDKFQKNKKAKLLVELMEDNLLKNNELLLGKTDILKMDALTMARQWIQNQFVIIFPNHKFNGLLGAIAASNPFKQFANELLQTFDTGVNTLEIEPIDFDTFFREQDKTEKTALLNQLESVEKDMFFDSPIGNVLITKINDKYWVQKIVALHKNTESTPIRFDLQDESDGTQRLLDFLPVFSDILTRDVTYVMDEIDQSLHPALLYALIHKIMADQTAKGQIIFSTHESSLLNLDLFRQDEIWFVEKNQQTGASQLYSLSEFKPRYDLDIQKGYLKGRFGAIPFLAPLENLKWNQNGL